jgi:hypothetical protein
MPLTNIGPLNMYTSTAFAPVVALSLPDSFENFGIIVTALIGVAGFIYTLSNNRRASYVEIISDARLEWIVALRAEVATLLALAHRWTHSRPAKAEDSEKLWQDIVSAVFKTRLLLTPKARSHVSATPSSTYVDNELDHLVGDLFTALEQNDTALVDQFIGNLLTGSQDLIWFEWLKTKDESINGDPYDTIYHQWKRKFQKWHARIFDTPPTPPCQCPPKPPDPHGRHTD